MKVTTTPGPLYDHATRAFYSAAEMTRDIAIANAAGTKSHGAKPGPRAEWPQSPSLAKTIKMYRRQRKDRPTATVGSRKSRHASVMERGGWSNGRGPHVSRNTAPRPVTRAVEQFAPLYGRALGRTSIAAGYMEHGTRERGPSFGVLLGEPR